MQTKDKNNNIYTAKYFVVLIFLFCTFILLSFLVNSKNKLIEEHDQLAFSFLFFQPMIDPNESNILMNAMLFSLVYGEDYFWSFIMVVLFFFVGREGRYIVFILLVSFLLLVPIGFLSKDIIKRDRPLLASDTLIQNTLSLMHRERTHYSYPSGRAIIVSTGTFVMVFHLLYILGYNKNNRNNLYFNYNHKNHFIISLISTFLVIEATWICLLQISTGIHHLTDILAGTILSVCASLFAILCFGKWIRKMQDLLSSIPVFSLFENHMDKIVKVIMNLK